MRRWRKGSEQIVKVLNKSVVQAQVVDKENNNYLKQIKWSI